MEAMKRFFVTVKRDLDVRDVPFTAAEVAKDFDVQWLSKPDDESRLAQIGKVPASQFEKLKNKFNDSGFFTMFEDIQFHTCG